MEVDHEVKKESEEKEKEAPSSEHSLEEQDNMTLAQISQTSKTFVPSTPKGIQKKSKVKKEMLLKVRKSICVSKPRNAVSKHAGKFKSCKQSKSARPTPVKVKSAAMVRAEEVQSSLECEFPSFVKSMVNSNVRGGFWMGLPASFCKSHMPKRETILTLEDERGEKYEVNFIAYKVGLSGGWKRFSLWHKLLEEDVLIFQLVEPTKFKVYIIRVNDLTEVDGALILLNLDGPTKQNGPVACNNAKRMRSPESLPLAVVQKKKRRAGLSRSFSKLKRPSKPPENDSENIGSEVGEGSRIPGPTGLFKDIISYDDFHILVSRLLIDVELAEDIWAKYYYLCCSKNAFLHDHLVKGLNTKLISCVISETVNIADAITACDLTTPRDEFTAWEKTLTAFEVLGMNVSFLLARLDQLVVLAFESEVVMDKKKCMEARIGKARTEEEIRNLKIKLVKLKRVSDRFSADIETLKLKAENSELKFHEKVTAPW